MNTRTIPSRIPEHGPLPENSYPLINWNVGKHIHDDAEFWGEQIAIAAFAEVTAAGFAYLSGDPAYWNERNGFETRGHLE